MSVEKWLEDVSKVLDDWIFGLLNEGEVPPVRISIGFPKGRATGKNATVGQCWATDCAEDGVNQIYLSPVRGEGSSEMVVATLLHEMIHASDNCQSGHRGDFARIARALGFEPPLTSSDNISERLRRRIQGLLEEAGPFPWAALNPNVGGGEKKQSTRMRPYWCEESGYLVRLTKKWVDLYGAPSCPCHEETMIEKEVT